MAVAGRASPAGGKLHVLLVDNPAVNLVVRRLLERTWHRDDYEAGWVARTDTAQVLLGSMPAGLVITAVRLQPIDGVAFARRIRLEARYACTPIVFHTATPYEDLLRLGVDPRRDGFNYVKKPSTPRAFFQEVETALREYRIPCPRRLREWD